MSRVAMIILPDGYADPEDFASDCGAKMPTEKQIAEIIMDMDVPKRLQAEVTRLRAERDALRAAWTRVMIGGNHIATYRTAQWPDYELDGLTREQQVEGALRTLGATREYDMWCCWSEMMQARDALNERIPV